MGATASASGVKSSSQVSGPHSTRGRHSQDHPAVNPDAQHRVAARSLSPPVRSRDRVPAASGVSAITSARLLGVPAPPSPAPLPASSASPRTSALLHIQHP